MPQNRPDATTWARLSSLFDAARELPAADWPAWLARLQRDQPDLAPVLPWLNEMLSAHRTRDPEDWLERGPRLPAAADSLDESDGLASGQRVGPWLLGERLGRGGMATVWRASRADANTSGGTTRAVALKLPRSHGGSARQAQGMAERFTRERDILARLSHPHIAPLFDAGVAADGTPWLAMECVEGQAIDAWCDAHKLGLRQRLALFGQVLDAVQYAHGRLVIHRDLKPSNILVTDEGQVRLLDFGIAKLLAEDAAAHTLAAGASALTQAAGRVMTPAYAAPEQLRGEALTTATDIYALGVVLFELLAGARPYRTRLDTPAQTEIAIAQGDLQRASAVASEGAAATRATTRKRLQQQLQGDLDCILAKAMHSEGRMRYASAAEFADDLQRWQAGETVRARADSPLYRLRRFVMRRRVPVAAATFAVLALVAALLVSLAQVQRADRERDEALAMRARGTSVMFFMMDQLMASALSGRALGAPETLARAEQAALSAFSDQPDSLGLALLYIGGQRRNFDSGAGAEQTLNAGLQAARDPSLRAEILCDQALAIHGAGRQAAALAQIQSAVADAQVLAGSRANCLDYQVLVEMANGDLAGALRSQQASLALYAKAADASSTAVARSLMMVTYLQAMNGAGGDPDPLFDSRLQRLRADKRDGTLPGMELRSRWASARLAAGDARGALPLIEENLQRARQQSGSPSLAAFLRGQAVALAALGQDSAALAALQASAPKAANGQAVALDGLTACLAWPMAQRTGVGRPTLPTPPAAPISTTTSTTTSTSASTTTSTSKQVVDETTRACAMAGAESALEAGNGTAAQRSLRPLLDDRLLAQHHRAAALVLQARTALLQGDGPGARKAADEAVALATRMQGQRPHSFRSAAAQAVLGDVLTASGQAAVAQQAYRKAAAHYAGSVDAAHAERRRVEGLINQP